MIKTLFLLFILASTNGFAAADKIYTVPETKAEILIGNQAQLPARQPPPRPDKLYYAGISVNSMTYKIPSLVSADEKFDQQLVGLAFGRKDANELFYYRGHFEVTGEWMRFKRKSSIFEQKLNLFQIDVVQNIGLAGSRKHSFFFSAGFGVAPMYVLGEQSVFGDSFSNFGASGILKIDFIIPYKKKGEFDLGVKGQWGKAGGHEIYLSSLNLGINFE